MPSLCLIAACCAQSVWSHAFGRLWARFWGHQVKMLWVIVQRNSSVYLWCHGAVAFRDKKQNSTEHLIWSGSSLLERTESMSEQHPACSVPGDVHKYYFFISTDVQPIFLSAAQPGWQPRAGSTQAPQPCTPFPSTRQRKDRRGDGDRLFLLLIQMARGSTTF